MKMPELWKWLYLAKGILTYVPYLNSLRIRRIRMGATASADYCYGVWRNRHLAALKRHGFDVAGSAIAELGPGDTIGTGLAALLSGAGSYIGIDVIPSRIPMDLEAMLAELIALYQKHGETIFNAEQIRREIAQGLQTSHMIRYITCGIETAAIAEAPLDLVFSQSVLEYVELETIYRMMFSWLRPGGYCSHRIDFSSHKLSPYWNGHWAYTPLEWQLART